MAIGDDAIAEGMDVTPDETTNANTLGTEISKTRDYIAQFFNSVKTWVTATFVPKSDVYAGTGSVFNKIPRYDGSGRLIAATPTATNQATSKAYVDERVSTAVAGVNLSSRVAKSGDTMTGDLSVPNVYLPAVFPATAGWTVAYINNDNRVAKGASSERYKEEISEVAPLSLGDVFPDLYRFRMRGGDGSWRFGWIAERLDEDPSLQPFVVYDAEGRPESIDFISLLMVQTAALEARVRQLEGD